MTQLSQQLYRIPWPRSAQPSRALVASILWLLAAALPALWRAGPLAAPEGQHEPADVAKNTQAIDPIDRLLAGFAAIPGLQAHFEEEKRVALLEEPLRSEGTLYFSAHDRLLRRVERPVASVVLLRGRQLELASGAAVRTIDLDAQPQVRAFVDSFRLILTGDRAGLEALFALELTGDPAQTWQLQLTPRGEPLASAVTSLRVSGLGNTLRELQLRDSLGDESVTRFRDIDTARRWSERERDELFRLPAP